MKALRSDILAFVLAGGKGERLYPLTLERTKPSVPFGGKYRIIDFALSNFVNSGIYSIYVLVQYKSQSLIEHIRTSWRTLGVLPRHFITVVPPQMRRERAIEWYRGTADSIYHNIDLIYDFQPRLVAIFGGDHIYRMNIKEMVDYHTREKAQLTIAVTPVRADQAHDFGIVEVDSNLTIKGFKEKPSLSRDKHVFASMGNYIFDSEFLIDVLSQRAKRNRALDFARDIIPYLIKKKARIQAYDFSRNKIPSLKKYEAKHYWRDVGSIESYWRTNMDLLGSNFGLDLDNQHWPIYTTNLNCPPAYTVDSQIENSLMCEGVKVKGAVVKNSILGRSVTIEEGCVVEDSIIMDFTYIEESCHIKKSIIDRFNIINKGTSIGRNHSEDKKKYYLDSSGIVVVRRGSRKML